MATSPSGFSVSRDEPRGGAFERRFTIWGPVLSTLALVLAGFLGTLWTEDVRSAFPLNLSGPYTRLVPEAVMFWGLLVVGTAILAVHQWLRESRRSGAQKKLDEAVRSLEGLIRTSPPSGVMEAWATFFETARDSGRVVSAENQGDAERVLRFVLGTIASLAQAYDGAAGTRYAANIMLYRDRGAEVPWERPGTVMFQALDDPRGYLDLLPELTATTGSGNELDSPDPTLTAFSLEVPKSEALDGGYASQVLPGAPAVVCSPGDLEYYGDLRDLSTTLERVQYFASAQRDQATLYFSDTGKKIRSFLSVHCTTGATVSDMEGSSERGVHGDLVYVLNIHSERAGLLKGGSAEALAVFVPMLKPFIGLLADHLALWHVLRLRAGNSPPDHRQLDLFSTDEGGQCATSRGSAGDGA